MRVLLPDPSDHVDLEAAYSPPASAAATRPFVRVNMISSLDGAISVHGQSGQLGGAGDRQVFAVLRSLTDVILVGAGTVRAEGYGPASLDADAQKRRRARGQPPTPPLAVVSRSCHLDWETPFFPEAAARPIDTPPADADADARHRGETVAEVVTVGTGDVDLSLALDALHARGARSVLAEGGPRLNAQLAAAGVVDELCLTLSPRLVAGDGPRLFAGPELPEPVRLHPVSLLEDDGFFFVRLRRERGDTP
jgi:5-amino-6-(5-phosphoribosylamino)uracil reductase